MSSKRLLRFISNFFGNEKKLAKCGRKKSKLIRIKCIWAFSFSFYFCVSWISRWRRGMFPQFCQSTDSTAAVSSYMITFHCAIVHIQLDPRKMWAALHFPFIKLTYSMKRDNTFLYNIYLPFFMSLIISSIFIPS